MVANALYLPAWLAGCGSHPWVSRISLILWIYRSAAIALAIWPDKKEKAMSAPQDLFGLWFFPASFFILYLVSLG
jgi:hypothetical protein